MSPEETARHDWQSSGAGAALPPLEELRRRADGFRRVIRRRNAIEYAAGAAVVAIFSAYALLLANPLIRVGAVLVVIGTLYVLVQLHRRASAAPMPERAGEHSLLDHQRRQLARQRDALANVFSWYLLPLIPGLLLVLSAPLLMPQPGPERPPIAMGIASIMLAAGVFAGIWWLNRAAARRLQREIDRLDALARD